MPAWRRVSLFSRYRLVPVAVTIALLTWILWSSAYDNSSLGRRTSPSMLVEAMTRADVSAIAGGTASPETVQHFTSALRRTATTASARLQPDERFVRVGFVPPETAFRQDESVGWPRPWFWSSSTWICEDRFHFTPPVERPSILWPGRDWILSRDWVAIWLRHPQWAAQWRFSPEEIRYSALPQGTYDVAILPVSAGDLVLALVLCALITSGIVRRLRPVWRWRRRLVAALTTIALATGLISAAIVHKSVVQMGTQAGWAPSRGGDPGWLARQAAPTRTDEMLVSLESDAGTRELAQGFLRDGVTYHSAPLTYLAITVGPDEQSFNHVVRVTPAFELVDWSESVSQGRMPAEATGGATSSLPRLRWANGGLLVTWASADGIRSGSLQLHFGALCWVVMLLLGVSCCCVGIVNSLRAHRARRRMRRGVCPQCGYSSSQPASRGDR